MNQRPVEQANYLDLLWEWNSVLQTPICFTGLSMPSVFVVLTGSLTLLAALNASAEVYRWVDDAGQVHFSSQIPHDRTPQKYKLNMNYEGDRIERDSLEEIANPQLKTKRLAQQAAQQKQQQRDTTCQQGKDYQQLLAAGPNQNFRMPGEQQPRAMTAAEYAAEQRKAERMISGNCR